MKLGRYIAVFILIVLALITFGKRGVVDNYRMNERLTTLKQLNSDIAASNQQLKATIMRLRNDPAYIEDIARNQLGMVKRGDIVYRLSR